MKNSLVIAFSITICSIAFVISKIVISVLLYKRWRRKHLIHEEGYPGGKIVIFRSSGLKSLKADVILKKTQKLNSKDIIGSGGYGVVYELKLDDSTALAIKRLNRGTAERDKGFERVGSNGRHKAPQHCDTSWILHCTTLQSSHI